MNLSELFDPSELHEAIYDGHVRRVAHPTLPLSILNYTVRAQFDRVWNDVTRQCRGLIYNHDTGLVVARPFPKFFNTGEHDPVAYTIADRIPIYTSKVFDGLDLDAPVVVTDKLDGSLGVLYPTGDGGHAIATRGSFTSDQAVHATRLYQDRYANRWLPLTGINTYLFEIVYPSNRIVVDYGDLDALILLDVLETSTGRPAPWMDDEANLMEPTLNLRWPGTKAARLPYRTLAEALEAPPREGAEGVVVYFPDTNVRVKVKQSDYVELHRILTGTNARMVWEVAAVHACKLLINEPKHWATYLGIDPKRAVEILEHETETGWLEQAPIPDEFYDWVRGVFGKAKQDADDGIQDALTVMASVSDLPTREAKFHALKDHPFQKQIMRRISADGEPSRLAAWDAIVLLAWRRACPEPLLPFARSEDVA